MAVILALVALIASPFTPLVVTIDDERERIRHEQSEPIELGFGITLGGGEFVPPSESGLVGNCVVLFVVAIAALGVFAMVMAGNSLMSHRTLSLNRQLQAVLGFFGGPSAMVIAVALSPLGWWFLGLILLAFLLASTGFGVGLSGIGGGGGIGC